MSEVNLIFLQTYQEKSQLIGEIYYRNSCKRVIKRFRFIKQLIICLARFLRFFSNCFSNQYIKVPLCSNLRYPFVADGP